MAETGVAGLSATRLRAERADRCSVRCRCRSLSRAGEAGRRFGEGFR